MNRNRSKGLKRNVCASCAGLRDRLSGKQRRINILRLQLQRSQALLASAHDQIRELREAGTITTAGDPMVAPSPAAKKPISRNPARPNGRRIARR
jgi:hypothetical protein